jgi:hypothetical protein
MWTTAGLTVSARALKFCGTIRTDAFVAAVAGENPVPSNSATITITIMCLANLNDCLIFTSLLWLLAEIGLSGQTISPKVNAKMTPR